MDAADDPAVFTDDNLKKYRVVIVRKKISVKQGEAALFEDPVFALKEGQRVFDHVPSSTSFR